MNFFTNGISNKDKPFVPNDENVNQNNKNNFFTNSHPEIYTEDEETSDNWNKFNKANGDDFFAVKVSDNFRRNYSKGKSFKFSEWNNVDTYNNDSFVQDWVTHGGVLYVCNITNTNVIPGSVYDLNNNIWIKGVYLEDQILNWDNFQIDEE